MTGLSNIAHRIFGGCVTVRTRDGLTGIWSPMDPSVWTDTASATPEELAQRLSTMTPRRIPYEPDRSFVVELRMSHTSDAERTRQSRLRGARKRVKPADWGWNGDGRTGEAVE